VLVQGQFSHDPIEQSVLFTELKKLTQLADPHPALPQLPGVEDCSPAPGLRQTSPKGLPFPAIFKALMLSSVCHMQLYPFHR